MGCHKFQDRVARDKLLNEFYNTTKHGEITYLNEPRPKLYKQVQNFITLVPQKNIFFNSFFVFLYSFFFFFVK